MIDQASLFADPPRTALPLMRSANLAETSRRLQLSAILMLAGFLVLLPLLGFAQVAKVDHPASLATAKSPVTAIKAVTSHPFWPELTPTQQQALAPLASSWNSLSEAQKRKWLNISKNYATLPPEGQTTMHSRMNEWVALSPQQRAQARLNFGKSKELSKELTSEEKKAKWQTYQALSAEEKQKLAAKASPKPAGAATALKPVAPQKLAAVPPHPSASGSRSSSKIPSLQTAPPPTSTTPHAGEIANGQSGVAPQR
jgi:Protein of unknown function (DUF3106)